MTSLSVDGSSGLLQKTGVCIFVFDEYPSLREMEQQWCHQSRKRITARTQEAIY